MARQQIEVSSREGGGKGLARQLRRAGRVPAVVYGHEFDALKLSVDQLSLEKASRTGANEVFDLTGLPGKGRPVLIRELQRDPVSRQILHCDFYAVNVRERVDVVVLLHFEGEPVGVKTQGGLFERVIREIPIRCLPLSIPESLQVDVSELEIGDAVHVSDLGVPEGVEVQADADLTLAHVVAPRVEEVEEAEEGIEGEAPEEGAEETPAESEAGGGESS